MKILSSVDTYLRTEFSSRSQPGHRPRSSCSAQCLSAGGSSTLISRGTEGPSLAATH
jgi:hypothetical protein